MGHNTQNKKIKTIRHLATCMRLSAPPSESGSQETFCLHLEALTLWLASISAARVKEETRPMLLGTNP
ncbi:MAG TPA: hypothetical protein DCE42_12835 [Myxococcales bacterium]|nr:hypothetical protein [Deltaproteobacteria bacterium]MBK07365.1 hypothetical protein [Deltaproteobacteria bacterium]MBU53510.1 hypothetical protein [Deltaproteobacteria bacterium]HAA55640.1 hypothetical protein [Myxococcales bacterium]